MVISPGKVSPPIAFRQIRAGFERVSPDHESPRHAHLSPYVSIVLDGGYDQAGYVGRVKLEPGDVLVQPALDRHESVQRGRRGVHVLRLNGNAVLGYGGVYRLPALDSVIRTAERDPAAASELLHELIADAPPQPERIGDWEDLLAQDLRQGGRGIRAWAEAHNLARETVARGFRRAYGASPRTFAVELRAREAWLRVVVERTGLAAIAADVGYADQSHMTRAIVALTGASPFFWRRRAITGANPA